MDKPPSALVDAIFELYDEQREILMETVVLADKLEKHLNQKERKRLAAVNRRYDEFQRERTEIRIALTKERRKALTSEQEAQYLTHCLAVREKQSETITKLIADYNKIRIDYLARTRKWS